MTTVNVPYIKREASLEIIKDMFKPKGGEKCAKLGRFIKKSSVLMAKHTGIINDSLFPPPPLLGARVTHLFIIPYLDFLMAAPSEIMDFHKHLFTHDLFHANLDFT